MSSIFGELRRRNVFRVAAAYAVVGWLIAQAIAIVEEPLSLPGWADTLVIVLLLAGFPIALLLAWAFELTPEGMKRSGAVEEGDSVAGRTALKLDYVIIAGLAAVVIFMAADRMMPEAPRTVAEPEPGVDVAVSEKPGGEAAVPDAPAAPPAASIAVLPFADLSPDGDQEYFSDGISEELLNVLARVDGLKVASRTSAFSFKGRTVSIPEIAGELGVRHVLEGSVRKAGETVRITAQLIDAANDQHLWSETYDRMLTAENLFEIQDEIATAIVGELGGRLGVDAPAGAVTVTRGTDDLTAYELYLQARELYVARQDLEEAEALFAEAVERDPDFAEAWELRAATVMIAPGYASPARTPTREEEALSLSHAQRAVALKPDSAIAIALPGLAEVTNMERWERTDISGALEIFSRALEANPNLVEALNWRGLMYLTAGQLEPAIADFETCLEIDPLYRSCLINLGVAFEGAERYDEALAIYDEGLTRGDTPTLLFALAQAGERRALQTLMFSYGLTFTGVERLYGLVRDPGDGDPELAAGFRALMDEMGVEPKIHSFPAGILALAEPETYDGIPPGEGMWNPAFARYRGGDAFKRWVRAVGMDDYWRRTGFPAACEPVGADDFDCGPGAG